MLETLNVGVSIRSCLAREERIEKKYNIEGEINVHGR